MTKAQLFTQARAARALGVSRAAVADRIQRGRLETQEVAGNTFVTARGLARWKADRARRAKQLTRTPSED